MENLQISASRNKECEVISTLDATKSRGPSSLPPAFYRNNSRYIRFF